MNLGRVAGSVVLPAGLVLLLVTTLGRAPERRRMFGVDAPIVGEIVPSVAVARGRVTFPSPTLPQVVLPDPCSGLGTITTNLKDVYASELDVAEGERQIGLTYDAGIWLSVTPPVYYSETVINGTELKPVGDSYDAEDYPSSLTTSAVRGHVAWVVEKSYAPCVSTGSSADAPAYPQANMAHMTWMENGVIVHMASPFSLLQMQGMAQGIVFV